MRRVLMCLVTVLPSCQEAPPRASIDTGSTLSARRTVEPVRPLQRRWTPGQPDEGEYENASHFSARSQYFSDGRLLLWLDSSTNRAEQRTRRHFVVADSVSISTLRPGEFFTRYCRIGEGLADGQVGGTARTLEPERWEKPRLAWVFDTLTSRIRSIRPDPVTCAVPEAD